MKIIRTMSVIQKKRHHSGRSHRHVEEDIQTEIEENIEKGQFQMELGQAGRNISYNDKKFLEESEATGIVFEPETRRFYPNGQFASHLIGYAEMNNESNELDDQLGLNAFITIFKKASPAASIMIRMYGAISYQTPIMLNRRSMDTMLN